MRNPYCCPECALVVTGRPIRNDGCCPRCLIREGRRIAMMSVWTRQPERAEIGPGSTLRAMTQLGPSPRLR
jgi:hypothetical protein